MENLKEQEVAEITYDDANIVTLEGLEHIRRRPGMYIGKLGDGTHSDDGIYVLLKEVIDNSIDEYRMGYGKTIEVGINDGVVSVRDYGRGIPLNSLVKAVSIMNTGGKFDSQAFKKSVGLNGVGTKAVNALSSRFVIQSFREGQSRRAEFECGILQAEELEAVKADNGTLVVFQPDRELFQNYVYNDDIIETMLRNFAYLNTGLTILFNGKKILSKNGLTDLLNENMTAEPLYPIIHLKAEDI